MRPRADARALRSALAGQPPPEAHALALVGDPGLERQPHPLGHVGVAGVEILVEAQVALVAVELCLGDGGRVGAEEDPDQPRVAELERLERALGAPAVEGLAAGGCQPVDAPPAAGLLALL